MRQLRNLAFGGAAYTTGSKVLQNPAPNTALSAYGVIKPIDTLARLACRQSIKVIVAAGPGRRVNWTKSTWSCRKTRRLQVTHRQHGD